MINDRQHVRYHGFVCIEQISYDAAPALQTNLEHLLVVHLRHAKQKRQRDLQYLPRGITTLLKQRQMRLEEARNEDGQIANEGLRLRVARGVHSSNICDSIAQSKITNMDRNSARAETWYLFDQLTRWPLVLSPSRTAE